MFLWKSWLFSKNERTGDESGVDSGNDNGVNNGDDKGEWIYVALCRFWYFTSGTLSSFLNFLLPFTGVNLQKGRFKKKTKKQIKTIFSWDLQSAMKPDSHLLY